MVAISHHFQLFSTPFFVFTHFMRQNPFLFMTCTQVPAVHVIWQFLPGHRRRFGLIIKYEAPGGRCNKFVAVRFVTTFNIEGAEIVSVCHRYFLSLSVCDASRGGSTDCSALNLLLAVRDIGFQLFFNSGINGRLLILPQQLLPDLIGAHRGRFCPVFLPSLEIAPI